MDDSDDVYRRPRDRRAFVDEELKRAGLSLTGPATKLPSAKDLELAAFIGPPVPAWWHERENWVYHGVAVPMSRHLYEMLGGGREVGKFEPEVPAMPDAFDGELASYDMMRRE